MAWRLNRRNACILVITVGVLVVVLPLKTLMSLSEISRTKRLIISSLDGAASTTAPSINVPMPATGKPGASDDMISLKDIHLLNDGSVDLKFNMKVAEMIRLLHAYSEKSFRGEMTINPLPQNITFSMMNSRICEDVPNLKYIIYVHTAPQNAERRNILRSTWARNSLFRDLSGRVVFLMGNPANDKERDLVLEESREHDDIVVGDFVDHYRNLTLKAVMGLKWVTLFCNKASYVIKADDDAFVNIFEVRKLLRKYERDKRVMICPLWKDNTMPILRDPSKCMKWCVRFNEFPGRTHFPQYCAGLTFIMSNEIVPELYHASKSTPFFWIDDVYVSGVLAPKIGNVHFVDLLKNFTLKEAKAYEDYTMPRSHSVTYYFAHVKKKDVFYQMWNATLHRLSREEISQLGDDVLEEYPSLKLILN